MMNKLSKIAAFYDNNETIGWRDGILIANVHDSLEKDYQKIRKGIALADYTYLGHFRVQGSDALQLIDKLCFSNLRDLPSGCLSPSYVLNEDGSVFCEVLIANCGDFYRILSEGVEPAHVHALFDAELAALIGRLRSLTKLAANPLSVSMALTHGSCSNGCQGRGSLGYAIWSSLLATNWMAFCSRYTVLIRRVSTAICYKSISSTWSICGDSF